MLERILKDPSSLDLQDDIPSDPNSLRHLLKDLAKYCKEQEENLILAAKYGQQLLSSNEELKAELESLKRENNRSSDSSPTLDKVKVESVWLTHLESQVSTLTDENASLKHELESSLGIKDKEINKLLSKVKKLDSQLTEAKNENERKAEIIQRDQETLVNLKGQLSRSKVYEKQLLGRLEELESLHLSGKRTEDSLLEKNRNLTAHLEETNNLLEEQRTRLEELEGLKDEVELLRLQNENLNQLLNEREKQLESLEKSKFMKLAGSQEQQIALEDDGDENDQEADDLNPSFFKEIDDRRVELENEHKNLKVVHKGILRKHKMAVEQQRKLTTHVKRMTLVNGNVGTSQESIERLNQALSRAISEKQELLQQIESLQREGPPKAKADSSTSSSTASSSSTGSVVDNLMLVKENQKLSEKITSLRFQIIELENRNRELELYLNANIAKERSRKEKMALEEVLKEENQQSSKDEVASELYHKVKSDEEERRDLDNEKENEPKTSEIEVKKVKVQASIEEVKKPTIPDPFSAPSGLPKKIVINSTDIKDEGNPGECIQQ